MPYYYHYWGRTAEGAHIQFNHTQFFDIGERFVDEMINVIIEDYAISYYKY